MTALSDREKTIRDFGDQWTTFRQNAGYYASQELLADIISPFLTVADIDNKRCAEIGAGTGRVTCMLLEAGAAHVTAIEPSAAIDVLRTNTAQYGSRVTTLHAPGEGIPAADFDLIVSIGVLHHIPDPGPVVAAALRALKPGGQMVIWLYGNEGSALYRAIFEPLRRITRRLPLSFNRQIANALYPVVLSYSALTRHAPFLPLARYLGEVWSKFDPATRKLAIIDQINPQWARYYRRDEAETLLSDNGFRDVRSYHRHGYSWTVSGFRSPAKK